MGLAEAIANVASRSNAILIGEYGILCILMLW